MQDVYKRGAHLALHPVMGWLAKERAVGTNVIPLWQWQSTVRALAEARHRLTTQTAIINPH